MSDNTLPKHARVVVVGAGIVGCSVAYHLTKLGWRDIVVVEQGPLFETGGSTSHAPGLVFQVNPSKTMAGFAKYTVDLWSGMQLDGEQCTKNVGSLEVAWTPERLADLKRKAGYGMSWGIEAHVISPSEAREFIPMLSERILGALYVPSDIQTKATRPAEAMAREAERNGGKFLRRRKGYGVRDRWWADYRGADLARGHQDRTRHCMRGHLGAEDWRVCGGAHSAIAYGAPLCRHHST